MNQETKQIIIEIILLIVIIGFTYIVMAASIPPRTRTALPAADSYEGSFVFAFF